MKLAGYTIFEYINNDPPEGYRREMNPRITIPANERVITGHRWITMTECFGNKVFKEIKARGEWGSFFSYSQYQELKRVSDPAVVIKMAQEKGYIGLHKEMTATELVASLMKQENEKAEKRSSLYRIVIYFMMFIDPVTSIGELIFDWSDRKSRKNMEQSTDDSV